MLFMHSLCCVQSSFVHSTSSLLPLSDDRHIDPLKYIIPVPPEPAIFSSCFLKLCAFWRSSKYAIVFGLTRTGFETMIYCAWSNHNKSLRLRYSQTGQGVQLDSQCKKGPHWFLVFTSYTKCLTCIVSVQSGVHWFIVYTQYCLITKLHVFPVFYKKCEVLHMSGIFFKYSSAPFIAPPLLQWKSVNIRGVVSLAGNN